VFDEIEQVIPSSMLRGGRIISQARLDYQLATVMIEDLLWI
jgi:hypothetical protein